MGILTMRIWLSGPRMFHGLVRPGVSFGRECTGHNLGISMLHRIYIAEDVSAVPVFQRVQGWSFSDCKCEPAERRQPQVERAAAPTPREAVEPVLGLPNGHGSKFEASSAWRCLPRSSQPQAPRAPASNPR